MVPTGGVALGARGRAKEVMGQPRRGPTRDTKGTGRGRAPVARPPDGPGPLLRPAPCKIRAVVGRREVSEAPSLGRAYKLPRRSLKLAEWRPEWSRAGPARGTALGAPDPARRAWGQHP